MILSFAQAAQRAGVSRDTINRHAKDGRFTITKQGNGYKGITLDEFERVYGVGSAAAKAAEIDAELKKSAEIQLNAELQTLRQQIVEKDTTIRQLEKQIERLEKQVDKYMEYTARPKATLMDGIAGLLNWNKRKSSAD